MSFFNGKKTNIGMCLIVAAYLITKGQWVAGEELAWLNRLADVFNEIGGLLGGAGLFHKVVKVKQANGAKIQVPKP